MRAIAHPDAENLRTHPRSDVRLWLCELQPLRSGRYERKPGKIDLSGHHAVLHSIRFALFDFSVNTCVDSYRCSGAHVAIYFAAMKYIFHASLLLTPQNRRWLILSTLLLLNATASLALQIPWSRDVERMIEGSTSAFNLSRIILSVSCSVPVRPFESNRLACRFMSINWISDSILVSVSSSNSSAES